MKITIKIQYNGTEAYFLEAKTYKTDLVKMPAVVDFEIPDAIQRIFRNRLCLDDSYELRISKEARRKLGANRVFGLEKIIIAQNALATPTRKKEAAQI